jgi:hypothetical protein
MFPKAMVPKPPPQKALDCARVRPSEHSMHRSRRSVSKILQPMGDEAIAVPDLLEQAAEPAGMLTEDGAAQEQRDHTYEGDRNGCRRQCQPNDQKQPTQYQIQEFTHCAATLRFAIVYQIDGAATNSPLPKWSKTVRDRPR